MPKPFHDLLISESYFQIVFLKGGHGSHSGRLYIYVSQKYICIKKALKVL